MAVSKPGSAALVPGLPAGDSRMRIAALLLGWRSHASCSDQTWLPGLYEALLSLRPSSRTHVTLSRAPSDRLDRTSQTASAARRVSRGRSLCMASMKFGQ
jgi:hypothetical protein